MTSSFSASSNDQFGFHALYDQVFQKNGVSISDTAMSDDGSKLIFSGYDDNAKRPVIYMLDADGSGLSSISLPEEIRNVGIVAINEDGSRAFFLANDRLIFRVQGGAATQIHEENAPVAVNIDRMKTTADGDYVYFHPYSGRNGIWRISQGGGKPEMIIEAGKVPIEDGKGISIGDFDVSADGRKILFNLYTEKKARLYLLDGTEFREIYKNGGINIGISGDGNTIVFTIYDPDRKVYSISSEPGREVALAEYEIGQYTGIALNYDGSKLFYRDIGKAQLINTDGSGILDIFPALNWVNIAITPTDRSLSISDNGERISFRVGNALYVGYLNDTVDVPGSPVIESIDFDPKFMPIDDPDARIYLKAKISDPQGLSDITNTACDELIDGHNYGNNPSKIPIYFYGDPMDEGALGDEIAGDGIFTVEGKPGGKIGNISQMTVRVAAMDRDKTVAVADTILTLGNESSPETGDLLDSLMRPTPEELSKWIALYEKAPNAAGTISSPSDQQLDKSPGWPNYSPGADKGKAFSLLNYLQYNPNERNQGSCGNCWQWAGTAIMEIQLAYKKDIKDRLSVEYINSNIAGAAVEGEPCCGDWLDTFANFYVIRRQAIPWTNPNARWMDSDCNPKRCPMKGESTVPAGSTSTSPAYSIESIRTEKVPTHGVGAETAINNIKSVLHQGKAVWFAYLLPNRNEWNRFFDFWKKQQEYKVFQIDAADGSIYDSRINEGGGHAVVCVGYDETDPNNRYWVMLNSWGTENGLRPNGLFRVNMDMNYDCQYQFLDDGEGPIQGVPSRKSGYALYFQTLDIIYADRTKYTALYRWFNPQSGDHFYTTDPSGELAPSSYTYEGITGYLATSQQPGTIALHRWFNSQSGDHFYTTDPSGELAPSSGYTYEGITGYIWLDKGSIPVNASFANPWEDPEVRSLIDEWLRQQESCLKKSEPKAYVDKWGRVCGEIGGGIGICSIEPDKPAGVTDNYHYLWHTDYCLRNSYPYTVRDYVKLRLEGKSFESLVICNKGKDDPCPRI